jgi:hypothetical protein
MNLLEEAIKAEDKEVILNLEEHEETLKMVDLTRDTTMIQMLLQELIKAEKIIL